MFKTRCLFLDVSFIMKVYNLSFQIPDLCERFDNCESDICRSLTFFDRKSLISSEVNVNIYSGGNLSGLFLTASFTLLVSTDFLLYFQFDGVINTGNFRFYFFSHSIILYLAKFRSIIRVTKKNTAI